MCAAMRQVQHVGGLLEPFCEFIAVPAAHCEGQRVKWRVEREREREREIEREREREREMERESKRERERERERSVAVPRLAC